MSIDVEDYFHVNAFRQVISPEEWDVWPSRVVRNVTRILDWLEGHEVRGTFFVLGWVARRHPGLVREIGRRGHEIASHGFGHQLIYEIGPVRFREDVRAGKGLLEDLCGSAVNGYRAPSYSITGRSLWALDILIEEGFTYDSSIFPIIHDVYGIPGGNRFPHVVRRPSGWIREFPISTWGMRLGRWSWRLPVGGGGYLRLFPAFLLASAFTRINREEGQPGILYFHPWEIDPEQPRVRAPLKSRLRHYLNLNRTFGKLEYLVRRLPFAPVGEVLDVFLPAAEVGQEALSAQPKRLRRPAGDPMGNTGERNGKTVGRRG